MALILTASGSLLPSQSVGDWENEATRSWSADRKLFLGGWNRNVLNRFRLPEVERDFLYPFSRGAEFEPVVNLLAWSQGDRSGHERCKVVAARGDRGRGFLNRPKLRRIAISSHNLRR